MRIIDSFKITLQYLVPQHFVSRCFAVIANSTIPWFKNAIIKGFSRLYNVDLSEAKIQDINQFSNFNQFFIRELRAGVRPMPTDPTHIISPVDGMLSQFGRVEDGKLLQAKGHDYTLNELLAGDEALTEQFVQGSYQTLYLAPHDYHRVHMPFEGTLKQMIYVPGKLFSVNQLSSRKIPRLFARNERLITVFETPLGPMAVILVGAMMVNGIHTVWHGQSAPQESRQPQYWSYGDDEQAAVTLERGAELGYFRFGSTVILLFTKNRMSWSDELVIDQPVIMGQATGTVVPH